MKNSFKQSRTNPLNQMFEWRNNIKISFERLSDIHHSKSAEQELITAIEYLNSETLPFFVSCLLDINGKNELEKKEIMKLTAILVTVQKERLFNHQIKIQRVMIDRLSKIEIGCSDICTETIGILVKNFDRDDNGLFNLLDGYINPCLELLSDKNKNIQISAATALQKILENVNSVHTLQEVSWNIALRLLKLLQLQNGIGKCHCPSNILICLSTLISMTGSYLSDKSQSILPVIINLLNSSEGSIRTASSNALQHIFLNFNKENYQNLQHQILKSLEDYKNDRVQQVRESVNKSLYIYNNVESYKQEQQVFENQFQNLSTSTTATNYYKQQQQQQIPQNVFIQSPKNSSVLLSPSKSKNKQHSQSLYNVNSYQSTSSDYSSNYLNNINSYSTTSTKPPLLHQSYVTPTTTTRPFNLSNTNTSTYSNTQKTSSSSIKNNSTGNGNNYSTTISDNGLRNYSSYQQQFINNEKNLSPPPPQQQQQQQQQTTSTTTSTYINDSCSASPIYSTHSQLFTTPSSPLISSSIPLQKNNGSNINKSRQQLTTLDLDNQNTSNTINGGSGNGNGSGGSITTTTTTSYSKQEDLNNKYIMAEVSALLDNFSKEFEKKLDIRFDELKDRLDILESSVVTLQQFHIAANNLDQE